MCPVVFFFIQFNSILHGVHVFPVDLQYNITDRG